MLLANLTASAEVWQVGRTFRQRDLETLPQAGLEVEHVVKILAAIVGGLAHLADADQVENDLAKITGRFDAPAIQHALRHVSVLLESILANGLAKLLPRQMSFGLLGRGLFGFLFLFSFGRPLGAHAQLRVGQVECFEYERVRVDLVAAIFFEKLGNRMGRIEHGGGASGAFGIFRNVEQSRLDRDWRPV